MERIIEVKFKELGHNSLNNKKHSHNDCYEILFVYSGDGVVIINNKLYPLKKNTIYFINGIENHCFVPKDDVPYIRSRIIIESPYIDSIANLTNSHNIIDDLFIKNKARCIELDNNKSIFIDDNFSAIKSAYESKNSYTDINITMALFKILTIAHSNKDSRVHTIKDNISKILTYISDNIHQKINLNDLCNHVHLSKYYLCHFFKSETNMTINEYIVLQRLSMAKKLLLYTDEPLSNISLNCGFSSFSYFSKIFKEREGVSPTMFRKKYKFNKSEFFNLTNTI